MWNMERRKPTLSVVTPVYGCGDCLVELYRRLKQTLTEITPDYEIIMVNDHSPDHAWMLIQQLAHQDHNVKGISLSRNFGQHHAITAGLDFADGDWVVVMDCDLQDQPEGYPTDEDRMKFLRQTVRATGSLLEKVGVEVLLPCAGLFYG